MGQDYLEASRVIAIILGGGAGTRLYPLTKERAKPAVPLAGKYRLVDIPISLCINSGLQRIFLLTQYLSSSLHRHVTQSYRFDDYYPNGFVDIMAASQSRDSKGWYQGTADAVRQNMMHFRTHRHDTILILSGDQLYRMDYRAMLDRHFVSEADVTVATIPVNRAAAKGFGIMQIDENQEIVRFVEKPREEKVLDSLRISDSIRGQLNIEGEDSFLASMGIYIFSRSVLQEALDMQTHQDFGKDIIPSLIRDKKVVSHVYQGYWEDIGTIRAFFDANLDLTENLPKFNFYDAESPIYSRDRHLPSSKLNACTIEKAVIADGCIVENSRIARSIIGLRSRIERGCVIENSILMGADYFETALDLQEDSAAQIPQLGIGENTRIQGAIIDKNARIGKNVVITAEGKDRDIDTPLYNVRDGVVVVPKNSIIPDGTVI